LFVEIKTDKRSIQWEPQPDLAARVLAERDPLTERLLFLARSFAQLESTAHFVGDGCTSIVEWAARRGFDPSQVAVLTKVGRVLLQFPLFEGEIRSGLATFERVAIASPVLLRPGKAEEVSDWIEPIRGLHPARLRARVKRALAEDALGKTGLTEVSVVVKDEVRERFDRCRELGSRLQGKSLTQGETFGCVVDFFLEAHDPQCVTPGTRRVPSTAQRLFDRYVPAEVEREIRQIAGDRCEVPFCVHHTFLALCHRTPHADGSPREVADLFLGCTAHHTLYDAGRLRMTGRDASGRAVFVDEHGREIGPPRPAGEDGPAPGARDRARPGGDPASPRRAGAGGDARSRAPSPGPPPDEAPRSKESEPS
jgi:hypothetical protein